MSAARSRGSDRPLVVDPATSARLGRVRQRGTSAELAVKAMLRQLGIRCGHTKNRLPGSPDFVNLSGGWCIFVHGCYWHAHQGCKRATVPKRNHAFWVQKFAENRRRDARVLRALRAQGLRVLVLWECEYLDRPSAALKRLRRGCVRRSARPPTSEER